MMNIPLHPHLRQTDVSSSPSIRLLNADCVEVMKTFEDKQFDLAIVDPGHVCVLDSFNDVSMDHEILNGKGKNRHFINNEVIGLVSIYFNSGHSHYPEAINIAIEKLENQPIVEEVVSDEVYCGCEVLN